MIQALFKRGNLGNWYKFEINGHANFGTYGNDVVCAGVSATSFMTINHLVNTGVKVDYLMSEGYASLKVLELSQTADILIQSFFEFMCECEVVYGKEFVKVDLLE